jgi:predicted acylesterase/phospholipase RssA
MINDRLNSENCSMSDVSHACPTFVVAKMAVHADGPPTVFRSYRGRGIRPSKCTIWQAARATTAAPSFFKEMYIDNPRPGIRYIDGGLGHNNPSEVALDEARRVWPNIKHFCLISVGTGHKKAVSIFDRSKDINDINTQRSLFEQVKSFVPRIVSMVPGWETTINFPSGVLALIKMANALSDLVTDSERVHQRLQLTSRSIDTDKQFPYFRFNVERDVGDVGLEDWKKQEEMAVYTASYLQDHQVEEQKMKCVDYLINPPDFKRKQPTSSPSCISSLLITS